MEAFKTQAMKKPRTNDLLQLLVRPGPTNLNSDPTLNESVVGKPVVPVSPTKSTTLAMATFLLTAAVHISLCFVSTIIVPNSSDFPSRSSPVPEYAHILPVNAFQPHSQTLSKISQSRTFAPAQFLADMLCN